MVRFALSNPPAPRSQNAGRKMGYSRGCSRDSIFLPAHWPDVNAMTAIKDVIRAHHRPKGSLLYGGIQPTQKQTHTSRKCGTATPAHGDLHKHTRRYGTVSTSRPV